MSVEVLSSYCFYTIALPFQGLLQNYLIWILLLIPCHFLFNRVVLVPVFSRPTAWFSDFVCLIIALSFLCCCCCCFFVCFTSFALLVIIFLYFSSDFASDVLTAYTYACTFLYLPALLQLCGAMLLVLGCGLSMEMMCPHSSAIIHFYCKFPLYSLFPYCTLK